MPRKSCSLLVTEAILCSFGLMIFSFFIPFDFPLRLISFVALAAVAVSITLNIRYRSDLQIITGESGFNPRLFLYLAVGFATGVLISVAYRWHLGASLFPGPVSTFALVAALIGSTEELVFRGYLQGLVRPVNGVFSILFATMAHTGYKCCLFLSPATHSGIDVFFLALLTFPAGILMGLLRHFSRSVWPALLAHAIFDIMVYGENINPPWWVW